ncbi:hypothetical protein DRN85_00170 [Methanosarcinales archaeon]|nr:MAG: hypothetical protein DRN85_00170 [Methanosarcinales archaeon]
MILSSFISIIVTATVLYGGFRIKLESRLKDLEHDMMLLEPIKEILKKRGTEIVKKVFEGEGK